MGTFDVPSFENRFFSLNRLRIKEFFLAVLEILNRPINQSGGAGIVRIHYW